MTNNDGRTITAKVVDYKPGESVDIELENGTFYQDVALTHFSEADCKYFKSWHQAREAAKKDAPLMPDSKIKAFVKSSRDDDFNKSGDPDDREVVYEPAITFDNEEVELSFQKVRGTLVFIGESVIKNREMHILYRENFTIDLPAGSRSYWNGTPFTNTYDANPSNGSAFGAKYEGYLLVLRDQEGKVRVIKASKSKWEKAYKLILNAEKRKGYSSDFEDSFTPATIF
ncbi:hypothetical protein [Coraliomargarita parva]|uniref:hypothetical protein n=1 Tax=Coraliomargarita parva TaxID=3014050 RepID=UPI0022B3FD43|nr:hypothetical protein [Coraliomargarita parva]